MLILTRTDGEAIRIGDDIIIQVVSTEGGAVKVGISAPKDVVVLRGELLSSEKAVEAPATETERPRSRLRLRRRPRTQPA